MKEKLKQQIQKAPLESGIYTFKTKKGEVLYIGKAANLKNRLKQYLGQKIHTPFMKHMLNETEKVETEITNSEIEALILESKLIKEKQPKFNIMLRDGKQYFYIGFTVEEFPRIFLTHQPYKIRSKKSKTQITNFKSNSNILKLKIKNLNLLTLNTEYTGPFTDGNALKSTLRLLRKVFPYCTCKQKHNNFCLNYHIGKCLGFCCLKLKNQNSKVKTITQNSKVYKKNIKAIKDILSGKSESLIKNFENEMKKLGQEEKFEKAIELRNKIGKLKRVFENARIISDANLQIHPNYTKVLVELKKVFKLSGVPHRLEGYDISNIQGKNAVGAMVVFSAKGGPASGGTIGPDKNEYRKFKIRFKKTPDDTAMLKEVLTRRLNHPEWPYPDLILIDGGKGQLNAAKEIVLKSQSINYKRSLIINTQIISLAKGKQEVFATVPSEASREGWATLKKPIPMKKLPSKVQNLILQIDSEAHRFAINYYRSIHRKKLTEKFTPY